ncbi:MAG: type II toxin-antitoxin system RelE/ParE family toxin [Myxococcaceae bacterium]|nr:type II toxin-antitoxin system RelE/ParE family toxin [Myxococcaceae bacterium]
MIEFATAALDDLEQIFDFNRDAFDEPFALRQLRQIRSAVTVLDEHPYIGRPVPRSELRELVVRTTRRSGFIVLYSYDEFEGLIRVVAVRHQRERLSQR